MKVNTMRCKLCHGEMALRSLGVMAGEEHGVRMSIEGMPAMQCPEGHKRFVAPDFALKLMQALLADEKLVPLDAAAQKGVLRKRYCCPDCGQELAGNGGSVEAKRVLELDGLEAFGVQVELPKLRCPACGRESVPPEKAVVDGLMKASANAFRSAQIEPT
jgi:ribosomal protein S27AE